MNRSFLERPVTEVAPELLGMVLRCGGCSGRVVEVEAYAGADDPASHGFGGQTRRNKVMFARPGLLYVYFTYGMHWCANVVCEPEGACAAVLIRALSPLSAVEKMWERRPAARRLRDLCSGPAKLTAALGIDGSHDGVDLLSPKSPVRLTSEGIAPPEVVGQSSRIGVRNGAELPWRWYASGDPNVSRRALRPPSPPRTPRPLRPPRASRPSS